MANNFTRWFALDRERIGRRNPRGDAKNSGRGRPAAALSITGDGIADEHQYKHLPLRNLHYRRRPYRVGDNGHYSLSDAKCEHQFIVFFAYPVLFSLIVKLAQSAK